MVYQGSKNKISKELKNIIEPYLKDKDCYVEPFVGGANMIDKIDWDKKIGADNNKYLIALLKAAQKRQLEALDFEKEKYDDVKKKYYSNDDLYINGNLYSDYLKGHYGFLMSHNARFFEGCYGVKSGSGRNYYFERLRNLNKQSKNKLFKNINFICADFKELDWVENSVIYLDPPYQGTTKYGNNKFNHQELWEMCKHWRKNNNVIFLSELNAPKEFEEIWRQDYKYSLGNRNNPVKEVVEKLFIYKGDEDDR